MTTKQTISFRRIYGRSEESAKKRSAKIVKKYNLKVYDELISNNLHLLLTDLTYGQTINIGAERVVYSVESPSKISFA